MKTYQPLTQQTTVACPKCGKEHTLTIHSSQFLLDGTPAEPMEKVLESIHVCDCGMLISYDPFSVNIMTHPGYEDGLKQKDETLRKIALLHSASGDNRVLMWYAQYYHGLQDKEAEQQALLNAIQALENGTDAHSLFVPAGEFLSMHTDEDTYLYPKDRLIDLYRRTRQWSKARKLIKECRNEEYIIEVQPYEYLAFLKLEERLLFMRNDSPK